MGEPTANVVEEAINKELETLEEGTVMNVPIITCVWIGFFITSFIIFIVLSLCSESKCSCCRVFRCCRGG